MDAEKYYKPENFVELVETTCVHCEEKIEARADEEYPLCDLHTYIEYKI